MKFLKTKIFLVLAILPVFILHAQSIDITELSEITPEQISQVNELINENTPNSVIEDNEIIDSNKSMPVTIADSNDIAGKKYGYDFFSTMPTSITAVGDLPLPNDYKISLKDQLTIILSGSRDTIFDLEVKLDGTILFPELGSIFVVGKTFSEVRELIDNLIKKSYIGVTVDISIKNLSAKKITIVGAVKSPGSYLVNPFSTITSSLAYSGGISEIGSLRNIQLIRNNGEIFKFDLYDLLISGDRSLDITVEAGDTILISPAQSFVEVSGSVIRPGIYEVLENETLSDLIDFGLGFKKNANRENISIKYLNIVKGLIEEKTTSLLATSLENAISVEIFEYTNRQFSGVQIFGAVDKPGFYDLSKDKSLKSLIEDLNFVEVYPFVAVLEQFDPETFKTQTVLFSLNDKKTYESITLQPNSKIFFSNIFERFDGSEFVISNSSQDLLNEFSLKINIKGKSSSIPVYGDFKINSLINLLGLDLSEVIDEIIYVSPLENLILKGSYSDLLISSSKFSSVTFRAIANRVINVSIDGSIEYPGIYSFNEGATLQDLYDIAGNLGENAYPEGAVIKKISIKDSQENAINSSKSILNDLIISESLEEGVNNDFFKALAMSESINEENLGRIAGNFIPNSSASKDLILDDGDEIIIPVNPNTFNVIGEVLNSASFAYIKNITAREAISLAGGLKETADSKNIYILRANGLSEKIGKNIFVGSTNLNPGDSVVVPLKVSRGDPLSRTIAPITQILSNLAFSAAAIDNLSNN